MSRTLGLVLSSGLGVVLPVGAHELTVSLPDQPVMLEADGPRLAQAFYTLLSNAAKYTPAGGLIQLSARDGLGIGLTLVRRIVEMHGGTVEAVSQGEGSASEFIVRLAAAADGEAAPAPAEGAQRVRVSSARRVLVADDNEDSAETMCLLLEALGNEVRIAHDGAQALEQAEAFRPDVALLDIGMPHMDGYEVARRLRAEPWGSAILLVALTGWGQDDDRRRSQEAGFDRHLVKPVDIEALQQVLGAGRPGPASGGLS